MAASVKLPTAALLVMLPGLAPAPAAAQVAEVEAIRVQLFHERSGKLSDDVIATGEGFWNVIIGEDPSQAFLISVVVRGKPETFDKAGFVTISVFDDKSGKKLTERTYRGGLLFGTEGRVIKPLMVYDQNCTPVRITARGKAGAKTVKVPFRCGE
jgi:hypothetical protein